MKFHLLSLVCLLSFTLQGFAQIVEEQAEAPTNLITEQPTSADSGLTSESNKIEQENAEQENAEQENAEQENEVFLTPEAKAKQEIADNNYSLSFFAQRMDLDLDQLDKARKFSEEDRMKRESLLKSIYMLRDQSRELEQQSIDKFKSILRPEQLAVFEELRKEQLAYRQNYDVLSGNVQQQVERERKIIELDNKQLEEEAKKAEELQKFEDEARRQEAEDIKHGRWNMFE